ncbi:MAG: ATP-binding protein [Planctomycetota bacterium]
MRIAVASGKGGTGKTTVATSLALALEADGSVEFLDCDVEEPNAHFFLKPEIEVTEQVYVPVPEVDERRCTVCGLCAEVCEFNAIAAIKDAVLTFPELCHGCTACWVLCPEDAITPGRREVGVAERGRAGAMRFHHGWLRVGEAMSPPLIRAVKGGAGEADIAVFDAPPGTSCPVVETVRDADAVVLVTEPTPFGLNDLVLAADMVEALGRPAGVVVNRAGIGDDAVRGFCAERGVPILLEVPFDRRVAEAYSRGEPLIAALPEYRERFGELGAALREMAGERRGRAVGT